MYDLFVECRDLERGERGAAVGRVKRQERVRQIVRASLLSQLEALNTLVRRYPDSEYWVEAQFRRGDLLFIDGRYGEAEQAFDEVTLASQERMADPSFLAAASIAVCR